MNEEKYKPVANAELAKAMQDLRRSSAAEPHKDRRTKRKRSREAAKSSAIRDSNW